MFFTAYFTIAVSNTPRTGGKVEKGMKTAEEGVVCFGNGERKLYSRF